MRNFLRICAVLALIWVVCPASQGQQVELPRLFEKREVMIPMRDGIKLHTEIYIPRNTNQSLPIFLERTPFPRRTKVTARSCIAIRTCLRMGMCLRFRISGDASVRRERS
jgi:predicted acyl esterase